ncbi:uncharacterized protein GGS22DRAFT_149362 [Annulohypoxylon maeteangense]|uniref:uncharacterized protein n=1 Tax=Annulohypoxylon maeteangense TaxID=1927788 RepID=UPI00200784A2|nr:uncharacterized protein GGS22DRAFT_149362 [Annulohypoxylon maeteangense]KAI0889876.1 hypothetical protein GGS22DRAFT_149362 [Annulohypoxylon maeteangense]
MADESIRKTPIPVPHIYGQPPTQSEMSTTNEAPAPAGIEQSSSDPISSSAQVPAPSTEAAASPSAGLTTSAAQGTTSTSNAASPNPTTAATGARTGTPLRNTNGGQENANGSSRAASQHPDAGFTMPAEAPPHGAPARQYLNALVTGPLLDGMKMLVREKPKDPLRALGEFLIQRSKETETAST